MLTGRNPDTNHGRLEVNIVTYQINVTGEKKVPSSCKEQVDFPASQVTLPGNFPNGQMAQASL